MTTKFTLSPKGRAIGFRLAHIGGEFLSGEDVEGALPLRLYREMDETRRDFGRI